MSPNILFIVILAAWVNVEAVPDSLGAIGKIEILRIDPCPNTDGNLKLGMGVDNQKRKVMKASLKLPVDFNKDWKFEANVAKWTGSSWKKNFLNQKGPICQSLDEFMPKIRDSVYALAKVSGKCDIPKGEYNNLNLYALEKDLKVPAVPYGKYQIEVKAIDAKNKVFTCYIIDVQAKAF